MSNCKYGFGKIVDLDFNTAIERITESLKVEGFGIAELASQVREELERAL